MYLLYAENEAYAGYCLSGSARMKVFRRSDGAQIAFFEPTVSALHKVTGGVWMHKTELAKPDLLNALYDEVVRANQFRNDRFNKAWRYQ